MLLPGTGEEKLDSFERIIRRRENRAPLDVVDQTLVRVGSRLTFPETVIRGVVFTPRTVERTLQTGTEGYSYRVN